MEVEIRPLEEGDVEELAAIEGKSFSMPWTAEDFRNMILFTDALYLVAHLEGRVVGSAGMRILGEEGFIDNVVVEESCRGRGIASTLMRELEDRALERGVRDLTLEVRVGNNPAIHVYEKAGFVREGIRPRFYENPTEDAAIYWKRRAPEER